MSHKQLLGNKPRQLLMLLPAVILAAVTTAAVADDRGHDDDRNRDRSNAPLVIKDQGSFSVGGHTVQGAGIFDPTKSPAGTNEGQTFWVDQMYVQYQIPVNPRKYPLVLVHGGGGTGRVWESTPAGREGYQSLFLRRGYSVYIVDFPRRGRAGQPTFNGPFGNLDGIGCCPAG